MLGCTRPRVARSSKRVTGPSLADDCSVCCSATCCHLALWWNAAVRAAGARGAAIRKAPVDCGSEVRSTLEESVAVGRVLASDAGHLRKALNIAE